MCIFHSVIKNILNIIHEDDNIHFEYARCYNIISTNYYIRGLTKYLRDYLKHCLKYQVFQTKKHKFYDSLQSIFTSSVSFHIIIIDFVLKLFLTEENWNYLMTVTCKFIKRILLILEKTIMTEIEWKHALLNALDTIDWKLFKIIISDRDKKFLSELWTTMFTWLNIKLFYFAAYHLQTNDQNERINQNVKIVFRFLISILNFSKQWSKTLLCLQRDFNNNENSTFNEIVYDFISMQVLNLLKSSTITDDDDLSLKNRRFIARFEAFDVIAFAQMNAKHYYDEKHQFLFMKFKDFVFIQLHREDDISFIVVFDLKLNQQYADSFKILKKIERLIYRLKLSQYWRIHSVFSVVQLKPVFAEIDFFDRFKFNHFSSIFVEDDINRVKSYTLKKMINKRFIARRDPKYLIKWKEYDFEKNVWRNLLEMKNVMNLIKKYEDLIKNITYFLERLESSTAISKSFNVILF